MISLCSAEILYIFAYIKEGWIVSSVLIYGTIINVEVGKQLYKGMFINRNRDYIVLRRVLLFVLIGSLIFVGMCFFFQPAWKDWANYDTTHGFYSEPCNTIETIFLGSSVADNGFIPMELYRDYGICAYNLGMEQQPMLASYYWSEEAYRLHAETLKTIVLDVSMMRRTPSDSFYQKGLDGMKFSPVKLRAVMDYTENFNEALSYLIPFFEYHSRWSSITKTDYDKLSYSTVKCVRGYNFSLSHYTLDYDDIPVPNFFNDNEEEEVQLDASSLFFLNKLIKFCDAHGIKLVLTKTPVIGNWSSAEHCTIQNIAGRFGLDFLDFNYEPYIDEMEYIHAADNADGTHMNYYGAKKLTAWFGEYLTEKCDASDVRENSKYSFMKDELADYETEVLSCYEWKEITELKEYLSKSISNPDYAVFIMAKDDAALSLTEETRAFFRKSGLITLSEISYRDSYYGIIDSGRVIVEKIDVYNRESDGDIKCVDNNIEGATLSKEFSDGENLTISRTGTMEDGTEYKVVSGGASYRNTAECTLDGVQYAPNDRGLNIVIYDKKSHVVVDTAVFDTYATETRDPGDLESALDTAISEGVSYDSLSDNLQSLYQYEVRCENAYNKAEIERQTGEDGSWQFISAYMERPNTRIYIVAQDDAASALGDDSREAFENIGLATLSKLEFRDSYIGVIENGKVIFEQKDHGELPISYSDSKFTIGSGGGESGNVSSITYDETEYSDMLRGLNIVIYDIDQKKVIDQANYDTFAIDANLTPVHIEWEVKDAFY